ncbi:hypothetical protein M8J77_025770 [Diaphorina citri]|nr:hypothetical protein M8J77_025770 [Diaphorina citri]
MHEEEADTIIITTDPATGAIIEQDLESRIIESEIHEIHEIPVPAENSPPDLQISFSSSDSTGWIKPCKDH